MKTLNISLTGGEFNVDTTVSIDKYTTKGATTVNISLQNISELLYKVNSAEIDWGDGSIETAKRELFFNYKTQSIFDEIIYGNLNGSVLKTYSHVYSNNFDKYEVIYKIYVKLTRTNGKMLSYYIPLGVTWGSYYDDIKNLAIINSQITPDSKNTTFVNLESVYDKTILPSKLDIVGVTLNPSVSS
jgi:hypothetical protein